jgi:hypothetical protein
VKGESPARLLLFWDYDTQWGAERSRSPGGPKSWGPLEFENTERLLELHARYDVPACFAVVGAAALPGERPYHDPEQIRRIHAAGHEVASHAYRHEWLPGLSRRDVASALSQSREALEQCLGAPVVSFVPPYNQPFDHPGRLAFSLSERRAGNPERLSLAPLCAMLREAGYRFARIVYRPIWEALRARIGGRNGGPRPARLETIRGVTCLRLGADGFDSAVLEMVERSVQRGELAATYGHPHSLFSGNTQDLRHLEPLLRRAAALRAEGRLQILRPRDLLAEATT